MRFTTWKRLKLASLALCLLTSLLFASLKSHSQVSQSQGPSAGDERERVLALGKKIFVERCARCHDEHGDKPLRSGSPMSATRSPC